MPEDRPEPTPQESEIAFAGWLPLQKFLGSKYYARGGFGQMIKAGVATALARGTVAGSGSGSGSGSG